MITRQYVEAQKKRQKQMLQAEAECHNSQQAEAEMVAVKCHIQ